MKTKIIALTLLLTIAIPVNANAWTGYKIHHIHKIKSWHK